MKKLMILAMVIMACMPLCATAFRLGVSVEPTWLFVVPPTSIVDVDPYHATSMSGEYVSAGRMDMNYMIKGSGYFGNNERFGIDFAVGLLFNERTWRELDMQNAPASRYDAFPESGPLGTGGGSFRLGFGYCQRLTSIMDLGLAFGEYMYLQGGLSPKGEDGFDTALYMGSGLYGSVSLDFTLVEHLGLSAGIVANAGLGFEVMAVEDLVISSVFLEVLAAPFVSVQYVF